MELDPSRIMEFDKVLGEVADQGSHRIWPMATGYTRVLSLGIGMADTAGLTPQFRHTFRDSSLRWGFDA
jgi:hypothetical protein